jgi:uncharacterized membrane protein (DUF4010 family)
MDIDQLLYRLGVALGIGLLTGLERGWRTRAAEPGTRAAGIRTFALCGMLGGLLAALGQATGTAEGTALVLGIGFAAYAAVLALFERDANRAAETYSATTFVAALLTFVLGAYAVLGDMRIAGAVAVAMTCILAAREEIHGWVTRITWPELRSALVLLAMTLIVLPLMPDTDIGPGGGVNPREVWLIAIVLAGVSFVGYGAVKVLGEERGVLLAALAGGLVSSTAVTLTSARRAAAGEGAVNLQVAGAAVASAVSFLRVLVVASVLKHDLLPLLAPPLIAATVVACAYAGITAVWRVARGDGKRHEPADMKNPFSFWPVVGFALFLAVVIVLGHVVGEAYGAQGALLGALGLGLADVDAVTISVSRLVPEPLSAPGASHAILAAVASNMAAKLVGGIAIGRGRFAIELTAVTAACYAAAAVALWGMTVLAGR